METSVFIQDQLLATKFYIPVAPGKLISRPRLTSLLDEGLKHPFMLVSAAAGFGKTTLLSTWARSLSAEVSLIAWISLDEEDNNPRLFWTYVLTALNMLLPKRFTPLLEVLQSPQSPSLKYVVTALINVLVEGKERFVLILDDYQLITKQEVHTTLAYLVEHLPPQLHIILATRADPPLPLPLLRAREQALEVRADQLRCTIEETGAYFQQVMGIHLSEKIILEVTTRTEGWLVGMQLLGLSLPDQVDAPTLLQEVSGDQRYILDYLIEEVLRQQPQEVQTFLLSTCILERLNASLCDALLERPGSRQMLQQLEQTNLFVVSLDNKRQWYRYHALFAQALRYQLEQRHTDLALVLHRRASLWYAERDETTEAVLHAFRANDWQLTTDLIERESLQLMSLTWGASQHMLVKFRSWLEQIPTEVMHSRPRLCLACTQLLLTVAPHAKLDAWLDAAEAVFTASIKCQNVDAPNRQQQQNWLGEVMTFRALLRSDEHDAHTVLPICQQALALLSEENFQARAYVAWAQNRALYLSIVNDAVAAVESGYQSCSLAQTSGRTTLAIGAIGAAMPFMMGAGKMRGMYQLAQQGMELAVQPGGEILPDRCWPAIWQAEVLREWNELDAALELVEEALILAPQTTSMVSISYLVYGYAVLLHIALSRGELNRARIALQQYEYVSMMVSLPSYLHYRSFLTTVDQVRFWLACGELDRAIRWAEELDLTERCGTPFAIEREEVARARILLATAQPALALQQLEVLLQRTTTGKRWGHVIEIRLLQALAYQMCQQGRQALEALSEAIHLAEPEGYIRSFLDEGPPIEALLYRLRKQDRRQGLTPYLDTLLTAFQQESKIHIPEQKIAKTQLLPVPLSERELQVLQLLLKGASNQDIAQELVIVVDTVKSHIRHIFSKLGVKNRMQAVKQARELGLLSEEL